MTPVTTLIDRKRAEVRLKLQSLTDDFAHWTERSAVDGSELRKHRTQIWRLTTQLGRSHAGLAKEIGARSFDALEDARDVERNVLALHRIWDFFRAKLAQRESTRLRPFLDAADDFILACFDPLMKAAAGGAVPLAKRRAQPLAFLNGGSSPFVQTREDGFQVEDTLGEDQPRGRFGALVRALPVSVVGLPWHEVAHVPELLLLAHEMGHVVEFDFALTDELEGALANAKVDADRLETWRSWFAESFADVFGALTGGPAFVGALTDLLAEPKSVVLSDRGDTPAFRGLYPSAMIRVRLAVETIRLVGHDEEADRRLGDWRAQYGEEHELSDHEEDCAAVAKAFIDSRLPTLGDRSLRSLVAFDEAMHEGAKQAATSLPKGQLPVSKDARELLAAVRLVFERNPAALLGSEQEPSRIVANVLSILDDARDPNVRGGVGGEASEAEVEREEAAGDAWFAQLTHAG